MSRERFTGRVLTELFEEAKEMLGPDAVLVSVTRLKDTPGVFEVVATNDPAQEPEPEEEGPRIAPVLPDPEGGKPRVLAFVGPTGSGKSSAVVKVATRLCREGKRVGVVNLDMCKPGAEAFLEAYGRIGGWRPMTAAEPADVLGVTRRFARCHLILVDTPGRGPREHEDRDAVAALLGRLEPDEIHWVSPAALPGAPPREVRATHWLPTKLDEYPELPESGPQELPIRWISDGQRVPRDLREAGEMVEAGRGTA